jgi:hypothetical protein
VKQHVKLQSDAQISGHLELNGGLISVERLRGTGQESLDVFRRCNSAPDCAKDPLTREWIQQSCRVADEDYVAVREGCAPQPNRQGMSSYGMKAARVESVVRHEAFEHGTKIRTDVIPATHTNIHVISFGKQSAIASRGSAYVNANFPDPLVWIRFLRDIPLQCYSPEAGRRHAGKPRRGSVCSVRGDEHTAGEDFTSRTDDHAAAIGLDTPDRGAFSKGCPGLDRFFNEERVQAPPLGQIGQRPAVLPIVKARLADADPYLRDHSLRHSS